MMVLCLAIAAPVDAAHAKKNHAKNAQSNNKYASIIIDADTGAVLSERYADKVLYPASLTKVMTLLLLFEAMESGNVRLNDKIYISQRAANQSPSKIGLSAGSSIRVEDAILALVTKSANDIAVAIAEHLAGTENRFAQRMTARAHNIGMTRTQFRNASGLPNEGQVSTARDMATLARYIIVRYPNYYRYFATKQFTYRGKTHTNHNRLMLTYPGMDGFKTGFINASGFNLIASAKRGENRLIGVVFGGRTTKTRNDHMAELLNAGFRNIGDVRYANRNVVPVAPSATTSVATAATIIPAPPPKPEPEGEQVAMLDLQAAPATDNSFTSLSSLGSNTRVIVPAGNAPQAGTEENDVTEDAIADVKSAINSGEYSEVTGQGDFDTINARRLEAGLLSAAVYKGEKKLQQKVAAQMAAIQQAPQPQTLDAQLQAKQAGVQPVAYPAQQDVSAADRWSIQIGAYNSRMATDDALRRAAAKLPANLAHSTPIVVPLTGGGEGVLFRARLGNFTKAEAVEACRYFRDCLPVAPR